MPEGSDPQEPEEVAPRASGSSGLPIPEEEPESVTGEITDAAPEPQFRLVVNQYEHSGPLPDQAWFQAVEPLYRGATEMILSDYRDQRDHERDMQKRSLDFDRENLRAFARYQTTRLVIAGGVALLIVTAAIVLIAVGKPVAGFAVVIAEVAGLVLAFFGTRHTEDRGDEPADSN
jgi:hypothetical protein